MTVLLYMCIGATILFSKNFYDEINTSRKIRDAVGHLEQDILSLSTSLGFNAMIHNFKNCVLRGKTEGYYCDRAQNDVARVKNFLNNAETHAKTLNIHYSYPITRKIISAYESKIPIIIKAHKNNLPISEIDKMVRIPDAEISREIEGNFDIVRTTVAAHLESYKSEMFFKGVLGVAISLLAVLGSGYALRIASQRERDAQIAENAAALEIQVARLEEAHRALEMFGSIASHDIKGPINTIGLYADTIYSNDQTPPAIKQDAKTIIESVDKAHTIINRYFFLSRSQLRNPNIAPATVMDIINHALQEAVADTKTKDVDTDIGPMPDHIYADANLLKIAFGNILTNSLLYIDEGVKPHISIQSENENGKIRFAFYDNGIGIAPQFLQSVFEPLRRLHSSESRFKGEGLGLTMAKTIANAHGGTVWVDPNYDQGTCMIFEIPQNKPT